MSQIDGAWHLEVASPMGKQESTLTVVTDGAKATGTMANEALGAVEITDGKVDGDDLSFTVTVMAPFKMKLFFALTMAGDAVTGKAKPGIMAPAKVKGHRL